MVIKSVAVIGAGPSGVISLDALVKEQAFNKIRVFERKSEAGGCWVYDPSPPEALPSDLKSLSNRCSADVHNPQEISEEFLSDLPKYVNKSSKQRFMDTATYEYLETNVERESMEYTTEVLPEGGTDLSIGKYGPETPFRHNTKIKKWVQDIYKSKGYDDFMVFNTSVELVKKNPKTGKWDITLRNFGKKLDYLWQESFDAVVVANGRYDVPYIPYVEGLDKFYAKQGKSVIHTKAFRNREHFRNKKVIVVAGSISAQDTVQDIVNVVKGPVISSIRSTSKPHQYFGWHAFEHPNVVRRLNLVEITEDGVATFEDGTKETDVDAVIFGTGYTVSFPFLPHLERSDYRIKHVYQHVFNMEDPTLNFVGNIAAGLTFKVFEWQAVASARYLAGRVQLPSLQDQYKWEEDRLKVKGDSPKFTAIVPDFEEYFEAMRILTGEEGPGRRLPKFDKRWVEIFERGHQRRINYWVQNNYKSSST